jgi:hypothetical protein
MVNQLFPSFNEYQAALQHPAVCFENFELKRGLVEADLWGLPRVRSGGFALTYKLLGNDSAAWAVRCFHRAVEDRTSRYMAISRYLANRQLDFFTPIRYIPRGVLVRGSWFPITLMKWVSGDTLETYLLKNYQDSTAMQGLSTELQRIAGQLETLEISHGDLSHRNILVQQLKMRLIDYDGMYVPDLRGRHSSEIGNIHFQHPGRTESYFSPGMDRFSEIVIYLALEALQKQPGLMQKFETGGEGLLFKRDDFLHPYQSRLLQELDTYSDLHLMVNNFRRICLGSVAEVPSLSNFMANVPWSAGSGAEPSPSFVGSQFYPVFDAQDRFLLLQYLGKVITVVGKTTDVFNGKTKDGQPHIFINFGNWRSKCFTIVLWAQALDLLERMKKDTAEYQEQWVKVTGLLTSYNRRPQIVVESPTDIEVLEDEDDARNMLENARKQGWLISYIAMGKPPLSRTLPPVYKEKKMVMDSHPPAKFLPAAQAVVPVRARSSGTLDLSRDIIEKIGKLYSGHESSADPGEK